MRLGNEEIVVTRALFMFFSVSSFFGVIRTGARWIEEWTGSEDAEDALTLRFLAGKEGRKEGRWWQLVEE